MRLLLLTGSRAGEALRAEWKEFDLSAPALDLLCSMKPKNATGPLFPGRESGHRVSLKRPWLQACKAAGLVTVEMVKGKRKGKDGAPRMLKRYKPTVRLHDLRHSYASHLVSNEAL